jgi:hypothetical protein
MTKYRKDRLEAPEKNSRSFEPQLVGQFERSDFRRDVG